MNLKIKRMRELCGLLCSRRCARMAFGPTLKRSAAFLKRRFGSKKGRFLPQKDTLAAQRALDYGALGWPAVSICVPLYNTPQNIPAPAAGQRVGPDLPELAALPGRRQRRGPRLMWRKRCAAYQARDARIVYTKVENKGISANTNAAAALAAGRVPGPCRPRRRAGASCGIRDDEGRPRDGRGVSVQRRGVVHFGRRAGPRQATSNRILRRITSTAAITSAIFPCSRKALFDAVGGLDPACDGSQDHDLFLKLSERAVPVHVPKVLYYWRVHEGSTSRRHRAQSPMWPRRPNAPLRPTWRRTGRQGRGAGRACFPALTRWSMRVEGTRRLSRILIPNKDHTEDLRQGADVPSWTKDARIPHYEVIVIENNSTAARQPSPIMKALHASSLFPAAAWCTYRGRFQLFSAINNFGRKAAKGEYLLLLNNDVEVINARVA